MKKLFPYFFTIAFINIFSFSAYAAEKGTIKGKVVEEVGGLAVPFAVVSVSEEVAEQPILTIQTDESGYFKFINLKPGTYKVKVSYVGFTNLFINEIIITEKDFDKNLGNLKLASEQSNLNEVVITAQKPLVEFGADVITYNVGSSVLAEGSTATDVLKNVPMVTVDIDGKATIAGKRSTRVFIDGKPSEYMTSNISDLLNVLPSDAIDKIEVMTNPPSKYSGDGEGILNIVMKKGFKVGFNGNLGINVGLQGNTNTYGNAAYKGKNYNLSGSAAYRQNIGKGNGESYRTNFFPDTTFYYNQFNNYDNKNNGGNFRIGFDWDITPKQNLRLSTNYNANSSDRVSGNQFHYLNEDYIESRLRNQANLGDGDNKNFVFNADYNLQTDTTGGKLAIGVTLNTNSNSDFTSYNRTYAFPSNLNPSLQQNNNETGNDGITFNLDYDKPVFKKRDQFEFGLAYNYRKNNNDLLVENFNYTTQEFITNQKLTNKFFFKENILSAYTAYNYRKNGWSLKTGLRAEYTNVNFDLSTGEKYNVNPYLSLFPNISINHFFKKRYNFGATYSVRINRPRENALNPQVNNADTLNISYGNPNLEPNYTHQMDFSFGAFGQKWSFTPRISYSISKGVIERYRIVNPNGISESTFSNVGSNTRIAFWLNGNFRPTNKITANASFNIVQGSYSSNLNSSLNRDGLSHGATIGFSMQLPYKTAFESNLNYNNNITAQGRNKGSISSSFGARKSFFKNMWSVRISTSDPFGRRNNNSVSQGLNFISQNYSTNNSSNVNLSLNYRFTKIKSTKPTIPPPPGKQ
ncbi:TonB-dependent receptor [Pedobacter polaris]|uniref:TonB-dependent receptor n=1 Tax=Pedobacter polaris TaxID=2571273 RepID=A0A4U1CXV7_9SPHI|nr:TonB-dependent receptor [Pedobacter polaris]TKC12339.1 TonB-dependent receptor [Pedobacter polaris]